MLRRWQRGDAAALMPLLVANAAHIGPWIPKAISTPAPVPELAERLDGFGVEFDAGRAFRYAILTGDDATLLGEADLFPRAAAGRVALPDATCIELGYWLNAAVTGRGFATEATRALFAVAETIPGIACVEIRCDVGNDASAAVPRRLGFDLARVEDGVQVWVKGLESSTPG